MQVTAPVVLAYVPAKHELHVALAAAEEYLPSVQIVQPWSTGLAEYPAAQATHAVRLESESNPLLHGEHDPAPTPEM